MVTSPRAPKAYKLNIRPTTEYHARQGLVWDVNRIRWDTVKLLDQARCEMRLNWDNYLNWMSKLAEAGDQGDHTARFYIITNYPNTRSDSTVQETLDLMVELDSMWR